ncbi:MoaD/ThiS family protein [Pseudomonas sp. p99-361]|uniref:Molybdopterin synthase sulfur carrier subunit n=1 Tax=Pseudomonas putida TaxID=303 RepID=A0A7W2L5X7_PSEPU|nr:MULTISPECIES: MoaD/ThiS family protein [Pseudomonas]MBA6118881.1 MoaD/ThiS family protein [Pseudomonas putida]MCO1621630.1 MoaD/ThiS family protein [Pseudomonas putida]PZQ36618.1 MAG: MoaD/ThiS family protein [Pseudomonas putida]QNL87912.1 Molybdopterin synthase small subunit [Pseudomonas putida]RRV14864.1 MoaD/ThiS family protein [Pseudomonas sp. p99-361]
MIRVNYFARYRELLGSEGETLQWEPSLASLRDLHGRLVNRGGPWMETLGQANLMCARNQELCSLDTPLCDGDDIAFFPPVTGG